MDSDAKLIKVGVPVYKGDDWTAGITYFDNLKIAVGTYANDISLRIVEISLSKHSSSAKSFLYKLIDELKVSIRGRDDRFLKSFKFKPDCIFSAGYKASGRIPFISWIPDFQHLHFHNMFSVAEVHARNYVLGKAARKSKLVVLSSKSAMKDFEKFSPDNFHKARLLHFACFLQDDAFSDHKQEMLEKYDLPDKFFYLPNQFWKHKNHITAFKAIKLLKESGRDITLVCSGNTSDYRNPDHYRELKSFVNSYNLTSQIRLLGLIPYKDVHHLMHSATAVINPSFFEGWSTTVEEARALGQKLILSDIDVHREQNPDGAVFFPVTDIHKLAEILFKAYTTENTIDYSPDKLKQAMMSRLRVYAEQFESIISEAVRLNN